MPKNSQYYDTLQHETAPDKVLMLALAQEAQNLVLTMDWVWSQMLIHEATSGAFQMPDLRTA